MNNLVIQNLNFKYGKKEILHNINLNIKPNTIYTLVGANGAGKTTLMNVIANYLGYYDDYIRVDGLSNYHSEIFLSTLYLDIISNTPTIKKFIKFLKDVEPRFDYDNAIRLITLFDLKIKEKIVKLSMGQINIFSSIIALSMDKAFILLDEPVAGLDLNYKELFYNELLKSYEKYQNTFIISTHQINEIFNISEDIIVLNDKEIIVNTSIDELLSEYKIVDGPKVLIDGIDNKLFIINEIDNYVKVLVKGQINKEGLKVNNASLEDVIKVLIKKGEHDD